jgi:hypothetical protein
MAFPVATRVQDELITPTIWNADLVGNMNSLPHLLVRKTSDETDSIGTLQNDDQLVTASIPANEVWQLEWRLICVSASSGLFQMAVTFPSGTFVGTLYAVTSSLVISATSSPATSSGADINTSAAGQMIMLKAVFSNGGTPGVVTLQWARATSGSFTVKANSTLWGVKLA